MNEIAAVVNGYAGVEREGTGDKIVIVPDPADARIRIQTGENGIAKSADGTRIIRKRSCNSSFAKAAREEFGAGRDVEVLVETLDVNVDGVHGDFHLGRDFLFRITC